MALDGQNRFLNESTVDCSETLSSLRVKSMFNDSTCCLAGIAPSTLEPDNSHSSWLTHWSQRMPQHAKIAPVGWYMCAVIVIEVASVRIRECSVEDEAEADCIVAVQNSSSKRFARLSDGLEGEVR